MCKDTVTDGRCSSQSKCRAQAAKWRAAHLHMHPAPLLKRRRMHAFAGERRRMQGTRRTPTHARSEAQKPRVGHVERREGEGCACRGAPCAWRCGVECRAVQSLVRRGEQTAGACRWRGQQQCELGVRVTAVRSASHPCQARTSQ